MTTSDHTVPRHYLRRFGVPRGRTHRVTAVPVRQPTSAFTAAVERVAAETGFYWGAGPDGEFHTMEDLLANIEQGALPAFARMLDGPFAQPLQWPPPTMDRLHIAMWMSAQLLRTTRQRHRLEHLLRTDPTITSRPSGIRYAKNNRHVHYMAVNLLPLADVLCQRPWGFGISAACLLTSDVPVVVLNGTDDRHQLKVARYWDIYVPLDPHRFLWLPSYPSCEEDPAKYLDHLLVLEGRLGTFAAGCTFDAADRHVFHHPHHPPLDPLTTRHGPRLPTPWDLGPGATPHEAPQYILSYEALNPGVGVARGIVDDIHLPDTTSDPAQPRA